MNNEPRQFTKKEIEEIKDLAKSCATENQFFSELQDWLPEDIYKYQSELTRGTSELRSELVDEYWTESPIDHLQISYNPDDLSQVDEIDEDFMSAYEASVENQFENVTIDFRREFGIHQSRIIAYDNIGNVIDDDDIYNEIDWRLKDAFNDF